MPKYLFDYCSEIFRSLNKADTVALFLDYDGTLVSFKDTPTSVVTPANVVTVLNNLIQHPKFMVFIVSGRPLQELKILLPLTGLSFVALHGLQIELSTGNTFNWKSAENTLPLLKKLKKQAVYAFKKDDGVLIEDKKFTVAFHYRLLPSDKIEEAITRFMKIVKGIDNHHLLDIIHGEKVVEVRPNGWHKGKALEVILRHNHRCNKSVPVYIGDDTTDEDAFRYIGDDGVTIVVLNDASKVTAASYWLQDPADVVRFLNFLLTI